MLIPTPEQQAIIDHCRTSSRSLRVTALAGAAKTTTLCLAAAKLPLVPTLCCAFNKKIADEMAQRMPSHVLCKTMNALGHAAWGQKLGRRLVVDTGKTYGIVEELSNRLPKGSAEKKQFGDMFAAVMRGARLAKSAGYIPPFYHSAAGNKGLIDIDTFIEEYIAQIDTEPTDEFLHALDQTLETSIVQAYEGKIDFDDQIYMSTLFGAQYPRYPIVLVDEAQDLSPLNHHALRSLVGERLIAVGDPLQAIYGFRGADYSSMDKLADAYDMDELRLSTSFRCPQAVVLRARKRAPDMKWRDGAPLGTVESLPSWGSSSIEEGAVVLCRNRAPLFKLALNLIKQGRSVKLVGGDIEKSLVKTLSSLGKPDMSRAALLEAITVWKNDQIEKAHKARHAVINDKAECLKVFAEAGPTLDHAIAFAQLIFKANGKVQLMTIHGAKGLEFDTVFYLDAWRIPSKYARAAAEAGDDSQMEQELNLDYVAITRSSNKLFYVNLDDFE